MAGRVCLLGSLASALFLASVLPAPACCPAPPSWRMPVVNADQSVIIIWDAATKTQHFIRKASFKSDADDFGFLVPTPAQPILAEAGNDAFATLADVTAPPVHYVSGPGRGISCGCGYSGSGAPPALAVRVLDEKQVAGFNAVVLEADSADILVDWLKEHGYAYSPEVAAWAKPYVDAGWKFTALKVAKEKKAQAEQSVNLSSLRMTFQTDRPLFPYREPDTKTAAAALKAEQRLLRIFFVGEARYEGSLTKETPWTGKVVWADKVGAEDRAKTLKQLQLPETAGPKDWYVTDFEDNWPYHLAPADVYFARGNDQGSVKKPPTTVYTHAALPTDVMACALAVVLVVPPVARRLRKRAC